MKVSYINKYIKST